MAFNKDKLKNTSQKLYKFCLEKGESTPEYSIRNLRTNQGFMYTAHCVALGHVEVGMLFPQHPFSYSIIIKCSLVRNYNSDRKVRKYLHQIKQNILYAKRSIRDNL